MRLFPLAVVVVAAYPGCKKGDGEATKGSAVAPRIVDAMPRGSDEVSTSDELAARRCERPKFDHDHPFLESDTTGGNGDGNCVPPECHYNSPVANTFPIDGVDGSGRGSCNPEGVRLVPGSLHGGQCGSNATLVVSGERLVGQKPDGTFCKDSGLIGASFYVDSWTGSGAALIISRVADVTYPGIIPNKATRQGYEMDTGSGHSVCDETTSRDFRATLGLKNDPIQSPSLTAGSNWNPIGSDAELIIPVKGPIYNKSIFPIRGTQDLFHFACAGDSIAKRTFYAIEDTADQTDNTAALRMLTATYCLKTYTVHGADLAFVHLNEPEKSVESKWAATNAGCLQHPRILDVVIEENGRRLKVPKDLPDYLQPPGCEKGTCTRSQYIKGIREECKANKVIVQDSCVQTKGSYAFESYNPGSEGVHFSGLKKTH